jgi:hypothetical protein
METFVNDDNQGVSLRARKDAGSMQISNQHADFGFIEAGGGARRGAERWWRIDNAAGGQHREQHGFFVQVLSLMPERGAYKEAKKNCQGDHEESNFARRE